jgi:hypothetical protein
MPKPVITEDLACQIRQSNVAILIQAMAERADLFKQAVAESTAKIYA